MGFPTYRPLRDNNTKSIDSRLKAITDYLRFVGTGGGGSGEINTASNVGGGLANFSSKSGVDLRFNSFSATDFDLGSNLISIDYTNGQAATALVKGFLTTADWNTFNAKQAALVSGTNIKTVNSTSLLGSGDVAVQATLVSGTNIKTINSTSLLGSGDIAISASPAGSNKQFQYNNSSAFGASSLLTQEANQVLLTASNTGVVPFVVKAIAAGSVNLQDWSNNSGTPLTSITKEGYGFFPAGTGVAPSIKVGGAGILEFGNGVGIYGSGSGFNAFISASLAFKSTTATIDIGNQANFSTVNQIRLSTTAEGAARFSTVASTAPVSLSVVAGENTAASLVLIADEGDDAADTWTLQSQTDNDFAIIGNTTEYLNITSAGAVTLSNLAGAGSRAVLVDANGLLSAPVSDKSVKKNIESLNYGLNTIMKLNPVSFEYIDSWKRFGEGTQIGFIAQDIQKVLPNSVFKTPSTEKLGYNIVDIVPILVKGIQELQLQIQSLEEEINDLRIK